MDALAAVLAILAAVCFALAATLWQRAGTGLEGVSFRHPKSFAILLTEGVWLLGLAAQIGGVVLQGAALDRGRVSIIQPLLVTTVIWAIPLGYFLSGQRIVRREVLGAGVIVVGLAVFASLGRPARGRQRPRVRVDRSDHRDRAHLRCTLHVRQPGRPTVKAAMYGTLAGVLYGLSATLMKPVVESCTPRARACSRAGSGHGRRPGSAASVQQISLATGGPSPSVATVSVANPVVSVLLGALVLQERLDRTPAWHAVVAVGGLALALFGAVVISWAKEKEAAAQAEAAVA